MRVEGVTSGWSLYGDSNTREGVKLSTGYGLDVFRRAAQAAAPCLTAEHIEALAHELDRR